MLFSSTVFLFFFLPIVFIVTRICKNIKIINIFLMIVSLFFYAWGEPKYIILMLCVIMINYFFGLLIARKKHAKLFLILCVVANLAILGYFKYFDFLLSTVNGIVGQEMFAMQGIILPIGISFYTFQALSYVIDLYREEIQLQRNPLNLALYISFFPQLIAGPIIKYHDVDKQIEQRTITPEKTAYGIKRFILGLSKKVILANAFALIVDLNFGRDMTLMGTVATWTIMILYTLQIYFDFSGYSDMAIGMGKMFGFDFPENFNFPYISRSIKEFWRRWHISLSTWFKEYVYIPLGGNRKGTGRTYLNLLIVFFCTGLWHGASVNFIIWGLWHGLFLVIERLFLSKLLERKKLSVISWIYTMVVVVVGWVFFRAETLDSAMVVIRNMFVPMQGIYNIGEILGPKALVLLVIGLFFAGIHRWVFQKAKWKIDTDILVAKKYGWLEIVGLMMLLLICIMLVVSNTYNPFIYFRF